ncbi:hypothetical protein [Flavobacterium sp. FlaQc-48]|uniref:hypothetical protein n=1 Tax=Flavobacterium sp. FlaQc-48 TaxID=3374181 RepID=UPI003757AD54
MRYTTSYTNSLNLFWILLIGFFLPFIIFPELNKIYLAIYIIFVLFIGYLFSIHQIYEIEIIDTQIFKSNFLKEKKEVINFEQIKTVCILMPGYNRTASISIVYLKKLKEDKIWFACFDNNDLKKLYEFFIENGLNVEILPKEKSNELSN